MHTRVLAATSRAARAGRRPARGAAASAGDIIEYTARIASSTDDALQTISDGSMDLTEAGALGLRSVTDAPVLTGLRFINVPLPPGATVQFAQLRFVARGNNSDPFIVRIHAHASDAAPTFTSAANNIGARALTTESQDWSIPAWGTGQDDAGTRSPDLAAIVQEVVNRPGFAGSIAFVIQTAPGSNVSRRRHLSFDDNPDNAPELVINTSQSEPPPAPPPPSELEYSFRADPTFDKNTALSGQALTDYDTLLAEIANSTNRSQIIGGGAAGGDLFYISRTAHTHITALTTVLRLTGDLVVLDEINRIADVIFGRLRTGWDPATSGETDYAKYSSYRIWRHYYGVSLGHAVWGKDNFINDNKAHALACEIATALDTNRDLVSPAKGVTYAADADKWKNFLLTDSNGYLAKIAAGRHGDATKYGFSPFRPHSDNHSWSSTVKLWYYLWRLTGDTYWKAAADRAADILWTHPVSGGPQSVSHPELRPHTISGGAGLVWMSNVHWASTSRNYLQSTAYANSVYCDVMTFHMEGYREWADEANVRKFARGVRHYHFLDSNGNPYANPSGILSTGIAGDVGGGSPNFKPTRAGISHDPDTNRPTRRTAEAVAEYSGALIAAWDDTNYIADCYRAVRDAYIGTSVNTTRVSAALFINSFLKGL